MDERVPGAEILSVLVRGAETAMKDEGIAPAVRERVVNRLVWGDPEGLRAVRYLDADEQVVPLITP
jgi:hypothetical protein